MTRSKNRVKDLKVLEDIDRLIHEPARLTILAHLYVVESADFLFLKHQTGLTWGNLSSHIGKLEAAGYVRIKKQFIDKKPHTTLHLTDEGRDAFKGYMQKMRQVIDRLPR
ncbi:MAG: winged helix-turn-helix domain-containing protein [Promethearchaeota archaeon]